MKQRVQTAYLKLKETSIISNFINLGSIQVSNILLQLLIIRILNGKVGITEFGMISWAYKWALLIGIIINYGTNQTGVKEVVNNLDNKPKLSVVLSNILLMRSFVFIITSIVIIGFYAFGGAHVIYLLLATPVFFAEVVNPLCFFIGTEKLRVFNIANLLSNVATVIVLFLFIHNSAGGPWVNFAIGSANVITYIGLLMYFYTKWGLSFAFPPLHELKHAIRNNFYLTVNSISGNLQQSVILFVMVSMPAFLGPYSLCDRIIAQCRALITVISVAIYPNSVKIYSRSIDSWKRYRKKIKLLMAGSCFIAAVAICVLADFIVFVLSGQHNQTAVFILRIMAFVPVLSALNATNVLDQLLKDRTVAIFRVSIIILVIAIVVAYILINSGNHWLIASFALILDFCALLLYEYLVIKTDVKNG